MNLNTNLNIIFAIICATTFSCHSSKPVAENDKTVVSVNAGNKIPACVKEIIKQFEAEPWGNPPRKIFSYSYNNQTVYYVSAICCDQFSDLYNDSCKLIAHPDGGFTGRGDRKLPDFVSAKTNEKLIWEDSRGN